MDSKEYIELKKEIEGLSESVKGQGETINRIHNAIVGDSEFGQEGIVKMVKNHDRWITSQKFMWAKIYGGIAVGSAVGTLLVKFWDNIF
tara:strand:- start:6775 stop:7041 length:267 start_codon:yes stop_codon:yes gene_type:complete